VNDLRWKLEVNPGPAARTRDRAWRWTGGTSESPAFFVHKGKRLSPGQRMQLTQRS
jgi:hypothetical protein